MKSALLAGLFFGHRPLMIKVWYGVGGRTGTETMGSHPIGKARFGEDDTISNLPFGRG